MAPAHTLIVYAEWGLDSWCCCMQGLPQCYSPIRSQTDKPYTHTCTQKEIAFESLGETGRCLSKAADHKIQDCMTLPISGMAHEEIVDELQTFVSAPEKPIKLIECCSLKSMAAPAMTITLFASVPIACEVTDKTPT